MLLAANAGHWSPLINIILNSYFSHLTTICVFHHRDYDVDWAKSGDFNVFLQIHQLTIEQSFDLDVFNYTSQDEHFKGLGLHYDIWIKKLMTAIQMTYCEGFVVFQDEIPRFANAFRTASSYSKWRSQRNRFLFIYSIEDQNEQAYFDDKFFEDHANILIIEAVSKNSSIFSLKTTKFSGSIFQQPNELLELSNFDTSLRNVDSFIDVFSPAKFQNLQGREIIVGAFDYRPFIVVDFESQPQYCDHAEDNPRHLVHIDGTEIHILHTFCELYNCTVQVDTTEKSEWGMVYSNHSGDGLLGMVIDGKIHIAMDALYPWDFMYEFMDHTNFLGRSGVTCLVPAPRQIVSWNLPLRPFQFNLWLGIFACLILESAALLIARQFEQRLVEQLRNASWWSSIEFGYITALKLFISQNSGYVVNSHTLRTLLFACYMIDIIITSIYGGGLSAILTIPTLEEAADSLERLYTHNLTWTGSSSAWLFSIAPRDDDDDIDPIYQRLLSNFHIYTTEEAREKAKTENMGFVVERMTFGHFGNAGFLTPQSLQRLKLMLDDIYYQFTVAIVPRLWAHLPKYNDFILAWHSSGFDKYWEWKIAADYMNVNEQNQVTASNFDFKAGPTKLGMKNFAGLWILWLIGISVSVLVFLGEVIAYRWLKWH